MDVKGYRGSLELNLSVDNDRVTGNYVLTIKDMDAAQVIRGELQGASSEKGLSLSLRMSDSKKNAVDLAYDSQVSNAGTFAEQSIYGIVTAPPQTEFGGGVWMAWHFQKDNAK
jgi:hypothetical protein